MLKITSSELEDLIETEMSEGCHLDSIEDYDNELEFYLSSAKEDDYVNYFLSDQFPELGEEDLVNIQTAVIEGIERKWEQQ